MPQNNSKLEYNAVCEFDGKSSERRAMFFASAIDISLWSGIPQKMMLDGGDSAETIGFQRIENTNRIEQIKSFYSEPKNISYNPILCAVRSPADNLVKFESDGAGEVKNSSLGKIEVTISPLHDKSFAELFGMLRSSLDERLGSDLDNAQPSEQYIANLKRSLFDDENGDEEVISDIGDELESGSDTDGVPAVESHLIEFRRAIAARERLCIEGAAGSRSEFAGFTKDRLISFLLPVVLVDGQHRLRGAIAAANDALASDAMQQRQLETYEELKKDYAGAELQKKIDEAKLQLLREVSPVLAVSLLLDAEPAEQVFQFVVVNQKSVPVGKALLGTIVSTTLTEAELEKVRARLVNAGIPLENSRAMTKLVIDPESPFHNKVDRGLKKESSAELLQWTVFSGLVQIVRTLQGAKLYHEDRGLDYASFWREAFLVQSPVVADYLDQGYSTAIEFWASENGPWEDFFIKFFSSVRDNLANINSEEAHNYWGKPKSSNIFNKVYLNILLADFFEYLYSKEVILPSTDEVPNLVNLWLAGATDDFFSRSWNLRNIKKDATATKKTWSSLWYNYRRAPSALKKLPMVKAFSDGR
ncbi:hypothetical protein LZ838_21710 [Pseudomonas sp. AA27]|uniref:hypothetical protein n=1 Tax=Pseudomonas sp. AA27 TaxID=2908652 RepID=UPI001F34D580|nr:hypothetical protein [Pseudomonas sp. AA27]MCF1489969.1 hypothetical protein [Pseudomonas sp. AA27]